MNTKELFEIFNHCVTQKDPDQILNLADTLQVFSSSVFSDGKIYYGEDAPGAFRSSFRNFCKNPSATDMRAKHKAGGNKNSVFVADLRHDGQLSTVVLNFGMMRDDWVSFIQISEQPS